MPPAAAPQDRRAVSKGFDTRKQHFSAACWGHDDPPGLSGRCRFRKRSITVNGWRPGLLRRALTRVSHRATVKRGFRLVSRARRPIGPSTFVVRSSDFRLHRDPTVREAEGSLPRAYPPINPASPPRGAIEFLGGDVTRPRAADDFATIRARMEELRRERAQASKTETGRTADRNHDADDPRIKILMDRMWPKPGNLPGLAARRHGSGR